MNKKKFIKPELEEIRGTDNEGIGRKLLESNKQNKKIWENKSICKGEGGGILESI